MLTCSARDGCEVRAYFACCLRIMWMDHLDPAQDHTGSSRGFEPEHFSEAER
jgi:hypothetical protein